MGRFSTAVAFLAGLALAGCSSSGSTPAGGNTCNPGTQYQLANPLSGSAGVSTTIGGVQLVFNASTDILGTSWNVTLVDNFGAPYTGGRLTLSNGTYKPYPTDYFYTSSLPTLIAGRQYSVYLNELTLTCTPAFVGTFST